MDRSKYRNPPPLRPDLEFEKCDVEFIKPDKSVVQPPEITKLIALLDKVIFKLENQPAEKKDETCETTVVKEEPIENEEPAEKEAQVSEEEGLITDDSEVPEQEKKDVKQKKHKAKHRCKSKDKKHRCEKRHRLKASLDEELGKPLSYKSDDKFQKDLEEYKLTILGERHKHHKSKKPIIYHGSSDLSTSHYSSSDAEYKSPDKELPINKNSLKASNYSSIIDLDTGYRGQRSPDVQFERSVSREPQNRRSPGQRQRSSSDDSVRSYDSRGRRSLEKPYQRSLESHHRKSPEPRRRKSPDFSRRRSPVYGRRKSPESRRRSTEYSRRSPDSSHRRRPVSSSIRRSPRRRSPSSRRRSPSYRCRSPSSRHHSPSSRRRSPDRIRRSPERIHRSPERIRRSPERIRRSPERIRRSPERIRRSPERILRRSPDRIRKSPPSRKSSISPGGKSPVPETNLEAVNKFINSILDARKESPKVVQNKDSTLNNLELANKTPLPREEAIDKNTDLPSTKEDDRIVKNLERVSIKTEISLNSCSKTSTPETKKQDPRSIVSYGDLPATPDSGEESPILNVRIKKEFKTESQELKVEDYYGTGPESYYCHVCQLALNSQLTWESHIRGKKHSKALKAQAVHEIAKNSIAIPSVPIELDGPRYAAPPAGRRRVLLPDISKIQSTVNEHKEHPMPGLDRIIEIRLEGEINYYCELCDAPCGPSSIMPHLIGFKHQLHCLKIIDPRYYDQIKDRPKKSIEKNLISELFSFQRRHGRGIIRVFRDVLEFESKTNLKILSEGAWDQSGWRSPVPSLGGQNMTKLDDPMAAGTSRSGLLHDECLDTSKGDLFCRVCDSHMNNINMWEAHVRGKRHLKNTKKIPGENKCKAKVFKAPPGTRCSLDEQLRREAGDEIIVGLNYIRETQGPNGDFYNCFVCGSCCTNIDIMDHLLNVKHRIKYLEKMMADGNHNAISTISQMDIDFFSRENLISEECLKMELKYGRGEVEVYQTKN